MLPEFSNIIEGHDEMDLYFDGNQPPQVELDLRFS